MKLDVMEPNPAWDAGAHEETVTTLRSVGAEFTFKVWCDDGCKDCRAQMPDFGAAIKAAGIPDRRVEAYPVERLPEGKKRGPRVEEYGIERIPTIVVERHGTEIARFVEDEPVPAAVFLAEQVRKHEAVR